MILERKKHTSKPSGSIHGQIKNWEYINPKELDLYAFASALSEGRSFKPDEYHPGADLGKKYNEDGTYTVKGTHFIVFDMDEDDCTIAKSIEKIEALGFIANITYRTFSYMQITEKHPVPARCHRVICVFKEEMDAKTALNIYENIKAKFNEPVYFDNSALNIGRMVFGGTCGMVIPNKELNKLENLNPELLKEVVVAPAKRRTSATRKAKDKKDKDYTYVGGSNLDDYSAMEIFDISSFKAEMHEVVEEWDAMGYDGIRETYYAISLAYSMLNNDNDLLDEFFKCMDMYHPTHKTEWVYYSKEDNKFRMFMNKHSFRFLLEYGQLIQEDTAAKFDIIPAKEDMIHLEDGQYVDYDAINFSFDESHLLVGGAGVGKTSNVVIKAEETGRPTLVLMPTKALVDDQYKNYKNKLNYGFQHSGLNVRGNAQVIFTTYEQYENYTRPDEILIMDEIHTQADYFQIVNKQNKNKKMNKRLAALKKAGDCIALSATVFNIPKSTFKNITWYTKDYKKLSYYGGNFSQSRCINAIKECVDNGETVLVYINSGVDQKRMAKKLEAQMIKTMCVVGGESKECRMVINGDIGDVKVVLTTKALNVGVDLQGIFDTLIYTPIGDGSLSSFIQFMNRDRQATKFIFFSLPANKNTAVTNINSSKQKITSNYDAKTIDMLNDTTINGESNDILYVNELFNNVRLTQDEILFYVRSIHPNFAPRYLNCGELTKDDKEMKKEVIETYLPIMPEDYASMLIYTEKKVKNIDAKMEYSAEFLELPTSIRKQANVIMRAMEQRGMQWDNELINADSFELISTNYKINRITVDVVRDKAGELFESVTYTPELRDELIIFFNEHKWHAQDKPWTKRLFIPYMKQHFGIYAQTNSRNRRVDHYENKTVKLGKTKRADEINYTNLVKHKINNNGYCTTKEFKEARKSQGLATGVVISTDEFIAMFDKPIQEKRIRVEGKQIRAIVYA